MPALPYLLNEFQAYGKVFGNELMRELSPLKGQAAIRSLGSRAFLGPGAGRRTHSCGKLTRAGWADSHLSARFPLASSWQSLKSAWIAALLPPHYPRLPLLPATSQHSPALSQGQPLTNPMALTQGQPLTNPTQTPLEGCRAWSKGWIFQWEGGPRSLSSLQSHQGPQKSHTVTASHVSLLPA